MVGNEKVLDRGEESLVMRLKKKLIDSVNYRYY